MSDDPQFGYGAGGRPLWTVRELARYEEALRKAGYRLQRDPDDDQTLLAWPTG